MTYKKLKKKKLNYKISPQYGDLVKRFGDRWIVVTIHLLKLLVWVAGSGISNLKIACAADSLANGHNLELIGMVLFKKCRTVSNYLIIFKRHHLPLLCHFSKCWIVY